MDEQDWQALLGRLVADLKLSGGARAGTRRRETSASAIARIIDHTLLRPDATRTDIVELCAQAAQFRFATVCVNPVWVRTSAERLRGTGVAVCGVVGFPLGATTGDVKRYEAARVIEDGASEVDMVLNVGALESGDVGTVFGEIRGVAGHGRDRGVRTKVIIEAGLLSDEEKVAACVIARAAGADYVKTSTGFGPGGATVEDVALMRRVVGPAMGVKAAGGIRTLEAVEVLLAAGASRIGTSAGVAIMREAVGVDRPRNTT